VADKGQAKIKDFFVPNPFKEDTWVSSIEIRPSDPSVVHHVIVQIPEQNGDATGIATASVQRIPLPETSTDAISGTIMDSSRALIPGVTVTATHVNTGVVTTTLSSDSGSFRFATLQPGTYMLTAFLQGLQTFAVPDIQVGTEPKFGLNITMNMAAISPSAVVVTSVINVQNLPVGQKYVGSTISVAPLNAIGRRCSRNQAFPFSSCLRTFRQGGIQNGGILFSICFPKQRADLPDWANS
jgi:hypothetical protein